MVKSDLVLKKIQSRFPDAVEGTNDFRGEQTLIIDIDKLKEICLLLRDDTRLKYSFLSDIVADDMLPEYPRFAVNYHLHSLDDGHTLRLRVLVEDPDEGPETLADIWNVAGWLETEVWDLMGIKFKGNDGLRRLFLPADWQGHPLRKDHPLGYEEVQFSFNYEEVDKTKPYALKD